MRTPAPDGIDPVLQAAAWQAQGVAVALATVTQTWGSAPCPVGSKLAVAQDGRFAGSVSGGCVEGEVIAAALACLDGAPARLMSFGPGDLLTSGLACGGDMTVLVEPVRAGR